MPGAVGGRPVAGFVNEVLRLLYGITGAGGRYGLIAAGGIFTAEDAYRKIRLGASLVQLYTALVYRGPGIVREIVGGLRPLLERDGAKRVADVVGADAG
jgi:dihydroorotate dehydrogenase